jgi:hypothetical protein
MNYTLSSIGTTMQNPQAFIARSKEKKFGRLKIYQNNIVYLEQGEEFTFELFNPTNQTILAKIEINGEFISNNGLVLKPAQRVFLERYFDIDRRFKFDIYQVEDFEKIKKDADDINNEKNHLEQELQLREQLLNLVSGDEKIDLESKIEKLKAQTNEMKLIVDELNNKSLTINNATKLNGNVKIHFYKEYVPNTLVLGSTWNQLYPYNPIIYGTGTGTITTNTTGTSVANLNMLNSSYTNTSYKETGRIEKGDISNQDFNIDNNSFEFHSFHDIEYKILPFSEKPIEIKDLRSYCKKCNKRMKSEWQFCPSCGEQVK